MCGGQEHRDLRCPGHDCQFTVCPDSAIGQCYLRYCEDEKSKTNQGGLVAGGKTRKLSKFTGMMIPTVTLSGSFSSTQHSSL